ncbi:hypothetical protein DVA67_014160 [Solirubrobacter sp. CPCC 204708]|uniref:DUF4177 domain-containing protein n=1 Tax=Solirubrobacter deserti TaxID=2282478 RepID=A0ABT4RBT0_9ACTN|nr:hypothetical protein [Solirubrobacter deserti]MBE2317122.1 hypothetical protein [Solirubrobacter deserti]MDA0135986.1 hypothetical protein [Solirubrobacter deserti]
MRYGFFLIERVPREWVELPDGSTVEAPIGEGEARIKAWWEANHATPPEAAPEDQAEWDARLEAFRAATTIDEVEGTRGFSTEPVKITRITFPDGHVDERALGGTPEEKIRRRFTAENPPPGGSPVRLEYDAWRAASGLQPQTVTGWAAELVDGTERTDVEIRAHRWTQGFPAAEVAEALNRFAADGWRVLHVSEDRGLYSGPHAQSDAFVTRARYLLGREPA